MTRIFVSYSRVDGPDAEDIVRRLRDVYGHGNVWMDDDLTGSDIWWQEILDQIVACDIFLYLLSNDSVNSPYCQAEYREAYRLRKRIITAQIRDRTKLTGELAERQYVEMSDWRHNSEQMDKLYRAIHKQTGLVQRTRQRWKERTPKPTMLTATQERAARQIAPPTSNLIVPTAPRPDEVATDKPKVDKRIRVFVSYSHNDTEPVKTLLVPTLREADCDPWYDRDLTPGKRWEDELEQEIARCDALLFVLTPASAQSEYCNREYNLAVRLGKPIMPVLLQDMGDTPFPAGMKDIQYVDFKEGVTPSAVLQLVRGLNDIVRANVVALPPQRPSTETRERLLETAMPQQVQRNTRSQVKVKISIPGGKGLRGELPVATSPDRPISKKDVRHGTFPIKFERDPTSGILRPASLCLEVTSDDFMISAKIGPDSWCSPMQIPVELSPDLDSRTINIHLSPRHERLGPAQVSVYLYQDGRLIAEAIVMTQIVETVTVTGNVWSVWHQMVAASLDLRRNVLVPANLVVGAANETIEQPMMQRVEEDTGGYPVLKQPHPEGHELRSEESHYGGLPFAPWVLMVAGGVLSMALLVSVLLLGGDWDNGGNPVAHATAVTGTQVAADASPTSTGAPTLILIPTQTSTSTPTPSMMPTSTGTGTPIPSVIPTVTVSPTRDTMTPTPTESIRPVTMNSDWMPHPQRFDGVTMMLVPPGCFTMGSEDGDSDEQPIHEVCFDEPFWIDRHEVTMDQYFYLGGAILYDDYWYPSEYRDVYPRVDIPWFYATEFCYLRRARLPTEAEWEYAARGPDSLVYPWGNEFIQQNYSDSMEWLPIVGNHPDGVSWVGAYDLSGSVWEWTSTIYDQGEYSYPYNGSDGREVYDGESPRVVRGGSWLSNGDYVTSAYRGWVDPRYGRLDVGFRCVRGL